MTAPDFSGYEGLALFRLHDQDLPFKLTGVHFTRTIDFHDKYGFFPHSITLVLCLCYIWLEVNLFNIKFCI